MALTEQDDIVKFIEGLEKESKAIREEALRICWWMRGSISYDEAMLLSQTDKEIISKIMKENSEASKQSGTPIY